MNKPSTSVSPQKFIYYPGNLSSCARGDSHFHISTRLKVFPLVPRMTDDMRFGSFSYASSVLSSESKLLLALYGHLISLVISCGSVEHARDFSYSYQSDRLLSGGPPPVRWMCQLLGMLLRHRYIHQRSKF